MLNLAIVAICMIGVVAFLIILGGLLRDMKSQKHK